MGAEERTCLASVVAALFEQAGYVGPVVAAGALGALTVAYGAFAPTSSLLCPVISRGSAGGRPRVALTFDDGPHPEATPATLDVLAGVGAKAAFFVTGLNVQRWPDLVRRMDAEGHLVCNHTFAHYYLAGFYRPRHWESQLRRADEAIERVLGKRPALFRPPLGIKTPHLARATRRTGHSVVTWSLRALDGMPTSTERILRRLLPRAQPGDILALHDGLIPPARRNLRATIEAIGPLVRGLRERGLEPVALDGLIGLPAYAGQTVAQAQTGAPPLSMNLPGSSIGNSR